jgi:hypothetical protein
MEECTRMPKNSTILKHKIVQQAYFFSLCENTNPPDSDPELYPGSQMKTPDQARLVLQISECDRFILKSSASAPLFYIM